MRFRVDVRLLEGGHEELVAHRYIDVRMAHVPFVMLVAKKIVSLAVQGIREACQDEKELPHHD